MTKTYLHTMKVNDKHLCAFANGTAPVDKEGYLFKRGEVNKSFQKRWFILKGNLLFYYDKRSDKEPLGAVILEGCTVELSESNDTFAFELVFEGSGSRTYVLSAETQEEMEEWMKAIACAGYDYMKLMVAELQRQLDDLSTDKPPASDVAPTPAPKRVAPKPGEGLLVDISDSDAKPPPIPARRNARLNPFNTEDVDLFGAPPLESVLNQTEKQTRSFPEMHRDFGAYISQKVAECKPATCANDLMS